MMRYLLAAIVACTLSAPGFAKSIDPEKTEEIMLKGEILAKLLGPESNWTRGGGLQPEYLAVAYKRRLYVCTIQKIPEGSYGFACKENSKGIW